MLEWIQDNPVLFTTLLWPVFTAAVSWVYTKLDGYPRLHAFFSLLAGMGIDMPQVLDAIKRLLTGSPPPAPPAKEAKETITVYTATLPPPPGMPKSMLLAAACFIGCTKLMPAAPPAATLVACITTDAVAHKSLKVIIEDCGPDAASVIEAILASSDTSVHASPAYHEAKQLQMKLAKPDGG